MHRINCFFGGTIAAGTITGGDRHGLEVWSQWSSRPDCMLGVQTSFWGRELIRQFRYPLDARSFERRASTIGPSRLGYALRCLRALLAAMRLEPGDVTYASSAYFYDFLPALVCKFRAPGSRLLVAVFHLIPPPSERTGHPIVNTLAWLEQRFMLLFVRFFADRVIVDNADLRSDLARMGIARHRIILSPMGVREFKTNGVHARVNRFDAIYVGRLAGPKGVPDLIDAWAQVTREFPSAQLALVGNNEVGFDPNRLIHNAGISENVQVFNGLSDDEVHAMLQSSCIFITGSREEGYGLSVLEALAAGLPCVTFDIPAFRFAFPYGRHAATSFEPSALARAAITLLADAGLRETLRKQITEQMPIRSWTRVAEELWSSCVGG